MVGVVVGVVVVKVSVGAGVGWRGWGMWIEWDGGGWTGAMNTYKLIQISLTLLAKLWLSSVVHVWYYEWYGQVYLDTLLEIYRDLFSNIFSNKYNLQPNIQMYIQTNINLLWMSFCKNFRYVWSSFKGTLNTVMSQETLASVSHMESCEHTFSVPHESVQNTFRWLQLHCITELHAEWLRHCSEITKSHLIKLVAHIRYYGR